MPRALMMQGMGEAAGLGLPDMEAEMAADTQGPVYSQEPIKDHEIQEGQRCTWASAAEENAVSGSSTSGTRLHGCLTSDGRLVAWLRPDAGHVDALNGFTHRTAHIDVSGILALAKSV